jgi:hypothetical protein
MRNIWRVLTGCVLLAGGCSESAGPKAPQEVVALQSAAPVRHASIRTESNHRQYYDAHTARYYYYDAVTGYYYWENGVRRP